MDYGKLRVMISGGGTGGHIFPAISIAGRLRSANLDTQILFIGAKGRMEMEKVPAAGFPIEGLPVSGINRSLSLSGILHNLAVPFRLLRSISLSGRIIRRFKPDVVVGVGGYASAPLLFAAQRMGIPTLIQEQNGFAGLTNRILGRKAGKICVAFEGMERFFPADRIVRTGNPIRPEIAAVPSLDRAEASEFHGFTPGRKHLLVLGGSLGARTVNESVKRWIADGLPGAEDVEVLWQCGRLYKAETDRFLADHPAANVRHGDFISRMDLAYAAADLVISRAGASSVSEICAAGKPCIFVPSPNVAEDHQTHNAMALADRDAAIVIRDADAVENLLPEAMKLIHDGKALAKLAANSLGMALPDAAEAIVEEIYRLV